MSSLVIGSSSHQHAFNPTDTNALVIPPSSLFIPEKFGKISVVYKENEFFVRHPNGSETVIARMDLAKELRGIPMEGLEKTLQVGYLTLNKVGEDYALRFNGRLQGGWGFSTVAVLVGYSVAGGAMFLGGFATGNPALVALGTSTLVAMPYAVAATGVLPPGV